MWIQGHYHKRKQSHIWMAIPEHPVQDEAGLPADNVRSEDGELPDGPPHCGGALLPPRGYQGTWGGGREQQSDT